MCVNWRQPGVGSVFSGGDDADPERETAKKKRKSQRELGECEEEKWGTKVEVLFWWRREEK